MMSLMNSELEKSASESTIGLIGMGLVGQALIARLQSAGYRLIGFDVAQASRDDAAGKGVEIAPNAQAVAMECEIVFLSLPNHDIVQSVMEQLTPVLRPGMIVVDTTTGSPAIAEAIAARLDAKGVCWVDATISGSSDQLYRGEVTILAGGTSVAIQRCEPLFRAIANDWMHVGPCGSGLRMKLVSNLVLGLNRAALAEGLAFADALQLDAKLTLEALRRSMAYSRMMDTKGDKMIDKDFRPQGRLSQHLKDVRLMQSESTIRLPLTEAHQQLLEKAEGLGHGDLDNSAIILAYDERPLK
jgi:3-hydroxyisobutyrate dehydrogenase-like beta-hydroxyacid dehydrogenase